MQNRQADTHVSACRRVACRFDCFIGAMRNNRERTEAAIYYLKRQNRGRARARVLSLSESGERRTKWGGMEDDDPG